MITKIDIEKYGLYSRYKWSPNIGDKPEDTFKKVNIIYGRNYSGKTTLSRILRSLELKEPNERYIDGVFNITNSDESHSSNSDLSSPYKLRVYNTDFVRDNLKFLYDENGDIKPFTLLGSENKLIQERIEEINNELGDIVLKTGLLFKHSEDFNLLMSTEKSLKKKQAALSEKLKNKANQEIKNNPYYIKQGTNYNITNIQKEIDQIIGSESLCSLNDSKKNELKTIINEQEKNNIQELTESKPKLSEKIISIREIISKEIPMTHTIQELINNAILESWVDKARELHRDKLNQCAFCGGKISLDRWSLIDAHFSKESDELKSIIDQKIENLESSKSELEVFLEKKDIKKELFYSVFHPRFDENLIQWEKSVGKYIENIELLISGLKKRKEEIFKPFYLMDLIDNSEEILYWIKSFNVLIKEQNNYSNQLESDKEESRKKLRFNKLCSFIKDINYKQTLNEINTEIENVEKLRNEIINLSNKIEDLQTEKKEKEFALKDEAAAALKVNELLIRFFGHNSLKLEPETINEEGNPRSRFTIKRGNSNAYNLSEGECSLISFCYFIAKMDDELKGKDSNKLIIYIDDPISSLDNNHIFFMFSLIESIICKDMKYGQLFISTHNLEFLKYTKRLTKPDKGSIAHFTILREQNNKDARTRIIPMPSHLKRNITEYTFLFEEIYNITKTVKGDKSKVYENQYSHFYNLANNMRKFLECYMSYRYPSTENPLSNLDRLFDNNIPILVNRVINEGSHLTWGDRGTLPQDIIEAETVAKEILKAIKVKDQSHFDSLCESIGTNKMIEF